MVSTKADKDVQKLREAVSQIAVGLHTNDHATEDVSFCQHSASYVSQIPSSILLQVEEELATLKSPIIPRDTLEKRYLKISGVSEYQTPVISEYLHNVGLAIKLPLLPDGIYHTFLIIFTCSYAYSKFYIA